MTTTRCPLCGQVVIKARSFAQVPLHLEVEPGTTKNHFFRLFDDGLGQAVSRPTEPLYMAHDTVCRERRGRQA